MHQAHLTSTPITHRRTPHEHAGHFVRAQRRSGLARALLGRVGAAGLLLCSTMLLASACAPQGPSKRAVAGQVPPSSAGSAGVLAAPARASDTSERTGPAFTRQAWTLPSEDGQAADGWVLASDNYRVFTTAGARIADRLPVFLESALQHYTSSLLPLPMPRAPMETYFLGTRGQWERVTQRLMGNDAGIYLRIDRGGYSARGRSVFYDIGPRDTFLIAAHESWHQYTQSTFEETLPLAIEEGIATYMEGYRWTGPDRTNAEFLPWRNFERFGQLRDAVAGQELLSLQDLLITSPQDLLAREGSQAALRYYAQVWAMIHFLVEGDGGVHKPALVAMIRDAHEGKLSQRVSNDLGERAGRAVRLGRKGVDVLAVYTGKPSEELDASYQQFMKDIVLTGASTKISQGQSPVQR